jgi:hypothetical protein
MTSTISSYRKTNTPKLPNLLVPLFRGFYQKYRKVWLELDNLEHFVVGPDRAEARNLPPGLLHEFFG